MEALGACSACVGVLLLGETTGCAHHARFVRFVQMLPGAALGARCATVARSAAGLAGCAGLGLGLARKGVFSAD